MSTNAPFNIYPGRNTGLYALYAHTVMEIISSQVAWSHNVYIRNILQLGNYMYRPARRKHL